ncbi:class I adenylate-forming enzyme family protein [Haloarchaeobius sp. DFWS5]|uniref:class I adenylate-forming enzyme family protein n=1 Tax=Haloarchaeobius sp. DFWS5 TaxID=3446114 RepID=UPI003EBAFD5C
MPGTNFDTGLDDQSALVAASRSFTVGDLLTKAARSHPDRVAVCEPGTEWTYAELDERVNRLANALVAAGVEPNESTIAVLAENRSELVELLFVGAKLGCLVAACNWRLDRDELVHCVDTVDPEFLFVSERFTDRVEWLANDADATPAVVGLDGDERETAGSGEGGEDERFDHDYDAMLASGDPERPHVDGGVDPEQGYAVIYTSGTTGLPKAAVVSHRAEFARATQVVLDYGLEQGDSYPAWAPMFHMAGIDWTVVTAILGGTFYPIDGFDPERIVEVLRTADSPLSWLILVPGVVDALVKYIESEGLGPADFQQIRAVGALLDLIDPEHVGRITAFLGAPAQNTYGATEVGHAASAAQLAPGTPATDDVLSKRESPLVDCKIVDESGESVPTGTPGEMLVRGPSLFSGYVGNPEATAADFDDGWFHTGDVLVRNEDGSYDFVNRVKYLVKSGGENIYPVELERVLVEHETVVDAVVVRVPDEKWGEVPRAVVGVRDQLAVSREELLDLLRDRVANYKLPHYVELVDPASLPRSSTGKIVRPDVEDWPVSDEDRVRSR